MSVSRRHLLGGLAAAMLPVPALPADAYRIAPQAVADGVWIVRGADEAIRRENGGAIANCAIIASPAGTILVDCGPSIRYGRALKAAAEGVAGRPVARVYVTHLHPDHGMGVAAFDPAIVAALPATIAEMRRNAQGFSDAFYRLLGDWMRGTDIVLPGIAVSGDAETFGGRRIRLLALSGHSGGDLALLDETTGTLIGGDLLFHDRAPSTPTADLPRWRESLATLAKVPHKGVIPGHGPFDPTGDRAISQTRDWIDWLEPALRGAVAAGLDMVEAGEIEIPARLAAMAEARYELQRSVSHLYPSLEAELLPRIDDGAPGA